MISQTNASLIEWEAVRFFSIGFLTTRFPNSRSNNRSLLSSGGCNDTQLEHGSSIYLIVPVYSTQLWNPDFLNLYVKEPVLLPQGKETLISRKSILHPLMVVRLVSGKSFHVKKFQGTLFTLSKNPEEKTHSLVISQPVKNGLAYVLTENWFFSGTFKEFYRILDFPF